MATSLSETGTASERPRQIGRYQILEELGRGAMSRIYLARDTVIGRLVALKTFRGVASGTETLDQMRKRLLREAQSAGRLSHPNVVTIFDVVEGEEGGDFYIAMEYVRGVNLEERLRWETPMRLQEVVEVISQIACALDHFHSRGVIHRDIKPANVLLTDGGGLKIADFGIAWHASPSETQDLAILGTPQYMAPEQIQGQPVDGRSDVFSLGVLLYEMLTRNKPFPGKTVSEVTHNILHREAIPPESFVPDLPPDLSAVVRQALAKDPDARYPSAGALLQDLCRAAGLPGPRVLVDPTAPTHALPAPAGEGPAAAEGTPLRRRPRASSLGRLAVAGVAGVAGVLLGWWLVGRGIGPAPPPQADAAPVFETFLSEGRALLPTDPEAATILFGIAERLAPDPEPARRLKAEAERLSEERGAARRFEQARQAVAERRYGEAIASTRALLASEAGHEHALSVLDELETALERPVRAEAGASKRALPPPAPLAPGAETASLDLSFASEAPRGVLTIYAGDQQVYQESFAFYRRRNWLWKEPSAGQLQQRIEVPPGSYPLRVLVTRHAEASQVVTLPGAFERGVSRSLEVSLPATGEAAVTLR